VLCKQGRVSTHLEACIKRANSTAPDAPGAARCSQLLGEATCNPAYWLHREVPAPSPFGKLEQVLRNIWLECCGHMSAFRFARKRIRSKLPGNFAQVFPAPAAPGFENEEQLMGEPIGRRLQPGGKLASEYDFGSTTNLSLRVPEERLG